MTISSTDRTVEILKKIASADHHLKIIVNARNFGHIRSPYYGILQSKGDAVILIVSDFTRSTWNDYWFIKKWEEGYKIVIGIKIKAKKTAKFY